MASYCPGGCRDRCCGTGGIEQDHRHTAVCELSGQHPHAGAADGDRVAGLPERILVDGDQVLVSQPRQVGGVQSSAGWRGTLAPEAVAARGDLADILDGHTVLDIGTGWQ
jgi:hypothetical protein